MITAILTQATASAWYIEHIWEILLALMTFLKVVGNLIPSEKPREVFAIMDKIINALVPDRVK
jgi:hypothetical protein